LAAFPRAEALGYFLQPLRGKICTTFHFSPFTVLNVSPFGFGGRFGSGVFGGSGSGGFGTGVGRVGTGPGIGSVGNGSGGCSGGSGTSGGMLGVCSSILVIPNPPVWEEKTAIGCGFVGQAVLV
jgi:hypothetical protein